jgi:hypothetical protein
MYHHIECEIPSPIKDFFLPLNPAIFQEMEIMAGPLCTTYKLETIHTTFDENELRHICIHQSNTGLKNR